MSVLERLSQKIDDLLSKMEKLEKEIEGLQLENSALINQSSEKDRQINTLYEELASRDRGYEDLINKIDEAAK